MARRRAEQRSSPEQRTPAKVARTTLDGTPAKQTHQAPHFRVSIDFGTTFTTVAFIKSDGSKKVNTVEEFPGDRCLGVNGTQVPTEIWYSTDKNSSNLYGYEITRRLELPESDPQRKNYENSGLITKPKLLLDNSAHLLHLRKALLGDVRQLKQKGLVKKDEDVIEHLLTCFMKHTKSVLERDHALDAQSRVELTIAVPVCWSATANAIMRTCLQGALKTARFGSDGTTTPCVFMVNEAEAAATHALNSDNIVLNRGECFILLDCGGGTTDSGTYKISNEHPLRLGEEVTHPKGAVCGSGDLNVRMHAFAASNLRRERYLENADDGITIGNIIDSEVMPHFESEVKRAFDISKDQKFMFRIRGLRESATNLRLKRNCFVVTSEDLKSIFIESLNTIEDLLLEQIDHAHYTKIPVDKVVLVGGFGDSPALKEHLKASLKRINEKKNTDIKLVLAAANTSAAGVAVGAIMRAQNKTNGPKRVPYRSIGILHHVSDHAANMYPREVLKQLWDFNELDQGDYIMNTIHWLIKAGKGEIETVHTFEYKSMHQFEPDNPRWIVEEALYASDTCVEDYYALTHPKNKGKVTEFGTVEFDVTHLKDRVQKVVPEDNEHGSDHYEVVLLVKMKVIDRNIEFTAYWPADDDNAAAIQGVQSASDLSSAFRPGTA